MITSLAQFYELATMADTAEECLESLRFGSHWLLGLKLRQEHGIKTFNKQEAIRQARLLCDEFLMAESAT